MGFVALFGVALLNGLVLCRSAGSERVRERRRWKRFGKRRRFSVGFSDWIPNGLSSG
jgi:hypothetical protein